MAGLGLEEVNERAALMTRVDRKYFVDASTLDRFFDLVDDDFAVLEIGGKRLMGYHSTYFDTADLATYRDHLKGRRRRYKVRLRTYTDTGTHFLEVKHKGLRAVTRKTRVPYLGELEVGGPVPRLGEPGHAFVSDVVANAYRQPLPGPLAPSYATTNRRATLVSLTTDARVTVDVDLRLTESDTQRVAGLRSQFAMIETKSGRGASSADRALRQLGVRPVKVSKYCAAVALLRPDLPSAPWRRVVRTYFAPAIAG
ncbi:polyphosphate polymerase domain-containing protein [Nocardioides phosphati]|nr:polyphosphate polymerase domain-containing protein [Nocardioides phosphati]